ncbi:hypothetical protein VYA_06230 [Vibrio alfacsensis]|nr:hypothetical protein VA249_20870 [Vibrio alfacsensis]BCN23431.1 hypothetical protein VYA_06230 [Vibrio alfacsensis]CAE6954451.1 hypothetical protein ACOMICROBIO_GDFFDHBD_03876 [Vibrio sp. B1REV9]
MFCHKSHAQNIMVEIYLTRNTSLQTQHRNNEPIDSQIESSRSGSFCGVKYRIYLAVRQRTFYNVSDKKN